MRIVRPPPRRPLRGAGLGLALFAAWTAFAFALGASGQATRFYGVVVRPLLQGGPEAASRWLAARFANPQRLELELASEDLRRLESDRERARASGALFPRGHRSVPGTLRGAGGEKVRVALRLKDDPEAHLGAEKWALGADVRGGATFLGMRRFSLQDPRARGSAAEWLYHRALRREDLLALRYEFVDLTLNRTPLGVYALEERFDGQLLARARRREGPILRFDEALMWREAQAQGRPFGGAAASGYGSYEASAIVGFRTGATLADPAARALHLRAAAELEAFRRGERAVAEVFDAKRLATYFALSDLVGAEHGTRWYNLRFYWNPTTLRFEPIGFDARCGPTTELSSMERVGRDAAGRALREGRPFHERVFADPAFHALYLGELARVSEPSFLDGLLDELGPELREATAALDRELPNLEPPEALLRRNQAYLRSLLEPAAALRASGAASEGSSLRVEVGNLQALPLEVLALEVPAGAAGRGMAAKLAAPYRLDGRRTGEGVAYAALRFELPAPPDPTALARARVRYRVLGTGSERSAGLAPHSAELVVAPDETRHPANPERFAFLALDRGAGTLDVRPGRWRVDSDLVVPPGLRLRAGAGTTLDLVRGAKIVSRSPVELRGREDAPVAIVSSDRTGQGLVVLQAGSASRVEHARFEGLRAVQEPGWSLTGALTFYESQVAISASAFVAIDAEDALHLIRSRAAVDGTTVRDGRSGGVDCDFCELELTNSRFLNLQRDAVDVSGGTARMDDVEVEGVGGDGIRIGEASDLVASRVRVTRANVGVAAEDRSTLHVRDLVLRECSWGVAAFQTKPELGPAEVRVDGLRTEATEVRHLVQASSRVVLDGVELRPSPERTIREVLHGEFRRVAAHR